MRRRAGRTASWAVWPTQHGNALLAGSGLLLAPSFLYSRYPRVTLIHMSILRHVCSLVFIKVGSLPGRLQ